MMSVKLRFVLGQPSFNTEKSNWYSSLKHQYKTSLNVSLSHRVFYNERIRSSLHETARPTQKKYYFGRHLGASHFNTRATRHSNGENSYRCSKYRSHFCNARLVFHDGDYIETGQRHSHDGHQHQLEVNRMLAWAQRRAANEATPLMNIYLDAQER